MNRIKLDSELRRVLKNRPNDQSSYRFYDRQHPWVQEMISIGFKRVQKEDIYLLIDSKRRLIVKMGYFLTTRRPKRRVPTLILRKFPFPSSYQAVLQPLVDTEHSNDCVREIETLGYETALQLYGSDAFARNVGKFNDQVVVFDW